MTHYIATFHTHLSAMRTERTLRAKGVTAVLAPVPRKLSASCGTCVRYEADTPMRESMDCDFEMIVTVQDEERYKVLYQNA